MEKLLLEYLQKVPTSLALIRAIEASLFSKITMEKPVLDLGCGDGLFAHFISPNHRVDYGVDINEGELELAKKTGLYQQLAKADIHRLPFANETFSTVFSSSTLEHISNLEEALLEINRILKPGGKLITTSPSAYYSRYLFFAPLPFLGNIYIKINNLIFGHRNLLKKEDWQKIFTESNFTLKTAFYYNSKTIICLYDLYLLIAIPSFFLKRLLNRYFLINKLRQITAYLDYKILVEHYQKEARETFQENRSQGGSIFLVAEKNG